MCLFLYEKIKKEKVNKKRVAFYGRLRPYFMTSLPKTGPSHTLAISIAPISVFVRSSIKVFKGNNAKIYEEERAQTARRFSNAVCIAFFCKGTCF